MSGSRPLRPVLVAGLVLAAVFIAEPWLTCALVPPFWRLDLLRLDIYRITACTFGAPELQSGWGLPGFNGPFWGNLVVGVGYLFAALLAAFTKRSLYVERSDIRSGDAVAWRNWPITALSPGWNVV